MRQAGSDPGSGLVGRDAEFRALRQRLETARSAGGSLALIGAPGIGKTALLDAVAAQAQTDGFRLLATSGSALESHLPFAGLHRLLQGQLNAVHDLPGPRRRAVLTAFGLIDGPAPEPFLLGLALLDLLTAWEARSPQQDIPARRSPQTPVLVAVDDAHRLDPETASVLAIAARRLSSDAVLLLAAARPGFSNDLLKAITDRLALGPIGDDDARALLRRPSHRTLTPQVEARLVDWAEGNPLALLELPKTPALAIVDRAGIDTTTVPMTARLREAFTTRAVGLPAVAQTAMSVLALNDSADLSEVLQATTLLTGAPTVAADMEPAVAAGLVTLFDERLEFAHALMRAAVAGELTSADRQRVHRALAEVLKGHAARSAWHRSFASAIPDERLAGELEAVAASARRRGGISVALAAQRRAVSLTDDPALRVRRLLLAAELAFELGDRALVEQIVNEVLGMALGRVERGRAEFLSEVFAFRPWTPRSLGVVAARAAEVAAAGETGLALNLLVSALQRGYWSDPGSDTTRRILDVADRLEVASDDALLLTVAAHAAPAERGDQVITLAHRSLLSAGGDFARMYMLIGAAAYVGDPHLDAQYGPVAIAGLRRQGRVSRAVQALYVHAVSCYFTGDWSDGMIAAAEAAELATQTSQPQLARGAQILEAQYEALRGKSERARVLLGARADQQSYDSPAHLERAYGVVALADGDHGLAFSHLRRLFDRREAAFHPWLRVRALTELVEAASASGSVEHARNLVADLEGDAVGNASPLLQASLAFARPLLASDGLAESLFLEASDPSLSIWPFMWARNRLNYGAWLRRQRQVIRSREPLRQARDLLDRLGAHAWAERARVELRAAGERSPHPVPDRSSSLTPQELQIASLAAEGLTNRQIGDRLFLSHRTVSTYLYQAFPKLGVSSRGQLATALQHSPRSSRWITEPDEFHSVEGIQ